MQLSVIKTYVYRMKVQRRFSYIHIHKFQGLEFHHYCTFCLHSLQQIATDAINIHLALAPLYAQLIKIHRLSIRTYHRDRLYRTWGTYYSVLPVYTAYPSPTACNDIIQTSTWLFISPSGNNNLYETVSSVLINKRFTAVLCHLPSGIITDVIMLVIFVFTNSKPAPYQIGSILCHLEFKSSSIAKLNTEECKKKLH